MFSRAYRTAITVPPLVWVAVFLLVPYLLMFCYSFWSVSESQAIVHSWNLDNYKELLAKPVYWQTLLRSMWIAARVMFFSMLLGYPLAYFLSFHAGGRKDLYYQLVIIPLWVSYLVRAYAWKTILGTDGILNTLLQYVHLTSHPLDFLLYSPFAVVLTLTHIYTPFTFLPIYAALEHIPRNLVEASDDLGATPAQTFWRVIFPTLHSRSASRRNLRLRPKPGRLSSAAPTRRSQRHHDLKHSSKPLRSRLQLAARRRHLALHVSSGARPDLLL